MIFTCELCKAMLFDESDLMIIEVNDEEFKSFNFKFTKDESNFKSKTDCVVCKKVRTQISSEEL